MRISLGVLMEAMFVALGFVRIFKFKSVEL